MWVFYYNKFRLYVINSILLNNGAPQKFYFLNYEHFTMWSISLNIIQEKEKLQNTSPQGNNFPA